MTLEDRQWAAIDAVSEYLDASVQLRKRLMANRGKSYEECDGSLTGIPESYADGDIERASKALGALTADWPRRQ